MTTIERPGDGLLDNLPLLTQVADEDAPDDLPTLTEVVTDETTSHSTRLSKDDSQVAGYEPGRRGSAPVVLSGGAEEVLRNRLNVPLRIVDNLVLQGLWLIAQETSA